jgi:hypothetical protein
VLAIGSTDIFTVAAPSLSSFLLLQTAVLACWYAVPDEALDALGLPSYLRVRVDEVPDEHILELRRWAGAELPFGLSGDPYLDDLSEDGLAEVLEHWSGG